MRGFHLELVQQALDQPILDRPPASRLSGEGRLCRRVLRELQVLHHLARHFLAGEDIHLGLHVGEPLLRENQRTQDIAQRLFLLGVNQQRYRRLVGFREEQAHHGGGQDGRGEHHDKRAGASA